MPFNSVLSVHPRHRIDCKLSWQVPCPLLLVNWALVPWGCLTLTTPSLDSTRPVTSTCHPEGWIPYLQPGRRRGQRRKEQKGHLRRNRGMRAVLEEVSWCLVGWAVRTCTCSVAIQWAHVMEMCDAYCVCPLPLPLPILLDPYRGQYDNSTRKNSGKDEFYGRTLKIFKGLIEYVFE